MAALACVYDAAPAPRRPHDVIAVPGGRSGDRQVRRGPHATAKWLTGSVARDAKEVIRAAFGQAEARDPARLRTWVVLVDGDRHQIELIEAEAARRDSGGPPRHRPRARAGIPVGRGVVLPRQG